MGGYSTICPPPSYATDQDQTKTEDDGNEQRSSRGHKARGQDQGHKKIRGQGQGQPFRGQALLRPRTEMLEAKAKDRGASVLQKKRSSKQFFRQSPIYRRSQNF